MYFDFGHVSVPTRFSFWDLVVSDDHSILPTSAVTFTTSGMVLST